MNSIDSSHAGDLWRALAYRLKHAGIDTALLDAELLLRHVTGWEREALFRAPEATLDASQQKHLGELGDARSEGVPVARLLGRKEFWSLEFQLSDETLIPRPESETLVAAALKAFKKDASLRLLDLGCGSGCLLLALLSERRGSSGMGVDISARAVATAQDNAARLGLSEAAHFQTGDWGEGIEERFDILVSNPPYIPAEDIDGLQKEVRLHEPRQALDGGRDGMNALRAVIDIAPRLLKPHGRMFLEVGAGQAPTIAAYLAKTGFRDMQYHKDLAGIERVVEAITP